ncbi:dUTP diphosphatase [Bacillus sp. FJAT-50079]|uniref:dUTP diphosphatase n=1 Tax=Bacillus sp. FJAT-50079 TaxID=2833577 RepID=UPI001BC99105|nr:dUTP diphosphatase [Bacillus sp. FJAT-50079]MBS4207893.1 dUTP diphosphatase [Bacillus sp. FJAT-50079]
MCGDPKEDTQETSGFMINGFIVLGEKLGFTWEQIEQAYISKNEVSHARLTEEY